MAPPFRKAEPLSAWRTGVAGLGIALVCTAVLDARADDRSKRLEEIRAAIEESRKRLGAFEGRSRGLLETLEAVEGAAAALVPEVERARAEARRAEEERLSLEEEASALAEHTAALQSAMRGRAVALYKAGEAGPLRLLFSAASLEDAVARARALVFLLGHDQRLLARYRADSQALERAREGSLRAAEERRRALARLDQHRRELAHERKVKQRLLARVRSDRARERAALGELETAAEALEGTLSRLRLRPARSPGGSSFLSLRGRLDPPVEAPVVRRFGRVVDAEFRTQTFRKGIDFDAPLGTPVRAVADGEVRYAGWFRGYGNMIILDHADQYFTICAHLARVRPEVGDRVEAGDEIGTVGDTGSLAGPLLYFEIRRGSQPLDPGKWLQARRAR